MSKKPKFLYRPHKYGSWFASLGRKLKAMKLAGIKDWGVKDRYRIQRELLRERNTAIRHIRWSKVYCEAYRSAYEQSVKLFDNTEKQASKYARQKAEQTVVEMFPEEVTSTRTVRDAMKRRDCDIA